MQKIFYKSLLFVLYSLLFVFPFFFLPFTQEYFITNKLYLLGFGVLLLILISTIQILISKKISWQKLESFGLEYKFIAWYLQDKISHNEMVEKLAIAIHQFANVGAYAIIGGASAITHDVPPFVMAAGNRAKLYGLNKVGLRRQGFSREEIDNLKKAYHILFRSGLALKDALVKLEGELWHSTHVAKLLGFIKASKRGITRESGRRAEGDEQAD